MTDAAEHTRAKQIRTGVRGSAQAAHPRHTRAQETELRHWYEWRLRPRVLAATARGVVSPECAAELEVRMRALLRVQQPGSGCPRGASSHRSLATVVADPGGAVNS